ncbi:MAG: tRNA preQ1(34) S-adenosylmethionine ribosyltransferase-isomerase QueA [Candidatus Cloacimonadota bacterium]|nr:MAG: tRNA preQ1(34) S-adenosylmethionine ribosyltransferase-isomerase QueA [Candidatus Cloacimonadota bacterium]
MQKRLKLKTSDFDYYLPKELIAQYPAKKRADSRLMILYRKSNNIILDHFFNLTNYLSDNSLLVINDTKVIPARLFGRKETSAKVEIFLLEKITENRWYCLVHPGKRLKPGAKVVISDKMQAQVIDYGADGTRIVDFTVDGDFMDIVNDIGQIPLPPYIKRKVEPIDKQRYQTIFAKKYGSVAAPTAGLHFTDKLLSKLADKGIETVAVNLNVGLGTFRPVKTEYLNDYKMHSEYCSISKQTADKINKAIENEKLITAVGTTSVRTLESFAKNGKLTSGSHSTDLFIYPGFHFQMVDQLITNFHLPKSSLLMLVCAFAGYEFVMRAYNLAVKEKFRFFSYGDAMMIL